MNSNLYRYAEAIFIIVLISSCVSTRPPVKTYDNVCSMPMMMPSEPSCLMSASYDGGFLHRDQFAACKQSVENYINALDIWYYCVMDDLRDRYNLYLDKSKKTLYCLEKKLTDKYKDNLSVDCPPVNIRIDQYYILATRNDPPMCVDKKIFFPKYKKWDLDNCKDKVEHYITKAKRNIEYGSFELQQKVSMAAEEATRKFNCYAQGGQLCF